MAIRYTEELLGKMVIKQDENEFEVEIRRGNCLAVFVFVEKDENEKVFHTLYAFIADVNHLRKWSKDNTKFLGDVVNIELNTKYDETMKMVKYLTKSGYKVNCYYE
jgi:hypothetical protein